jgi:AraC family transcriptional regulator of adaptative response/methylated-DNA-[protein]-cysteine methyltransferase
MTSSTTATDSNEDNPLNSRKHKKVQPNRQPPHNPESERKYAGNRLTVSKCRMNAIATLAGKRDLVAVDGLDPRLYDFLNSQVLFCRRPRSLAGSNQHDRDGAGSTMTSKSSLKNTIAWTAVSRKDRRYDGKFVYGAVTTGIYCRPSCPARNPKPRNIRMFGTADEAERRGYTACLRCYPNSLAPAERSVQVVLDYVERNLDRLITLNTLSNVASLSPHHLQHVFKRIVGVSPKTYCDARRLAGFKERLRGGQSIASACYEAGYGSSRALYQGARKTMGMTPSAYRRGGKGVRIWYAITKRSRDTVLIARTELGLSAVLSSGEENVLVGELKREFPLADFTRESSSRWKSAVRSCEMEDPLLSKLPLKLQRRIMQAKLWDAITTRIF